MSINLIKCFIIISATVLIILLFIFCVQSYKKSSQLEPYKQERLVVTVPANIATLNIYKEVVRNFEKKHPKVKVILYSIPETAYYQKLLVMIAGRVGPDVMWMGQGFSEFIDRDIFLDVTDRVRRDVDIGNYAAPIIKWYRWNQNQYGVPFGIDMRFLVYNKKHFREAGIPYPSNNWTFSEFLEAAKKLTIRDPHNPNRTVRYSTNAILPDFLFGGQFIREKDLRVECNSMETIDFLKTNLAMYNKWRVTPRPSEQQGLDAFSLFVRERLSIMQFSTFHLPYMKDRFRDMDWDIAPWPTIKLHGFWASSQAMLISKETKYPDLAWALCKEFLTREVQLKMAVITLPSHRRYAQEAMNNMTGNPHNYKILINSFDNLFPSPHIPNLQEFMTIRRNAIENVWAGLDSPEKAMRQLEKKIKRKLKKLQTGMQERK